jgi:predicted DNA-binding transcriptional regulator AlpA
VVNLRRNLLVGRSGLPEGSTGAGASDAPADYVKANDNLIPARGVWQRYGVTSMTLYRWIAEADLAFPLPVYIGRFRYWRLSELLAWEAERPRKGQQFGAARAPETEGA